MKNLQNVLLTTIGPWMVQFLVETTSSDDILREIRTIHIWRTLLNFNRWIRKPIPVPLIGRLMIAKIIPTIKSLPLSDNTLVQPLEELCAETLAILLEEFYRCTDEDRLLHLDVVVATYVSFCQSPQSNGRCIVQCLL